MADINQIISLGIGTPSDIPHFLLLGLTPEGTPPVNPTPEYVIVCRADVGTIQCRADVGVIKP